MNIISASQSLFENTSQADLSRYRQMLFNVHQRTNYGEGENKEKMLLQRMKGGAGKRVHARYKQLNNEFNQLPEVMQRQIISKLMRTFQSNPNA